MLLDKTLMTFRGKSSIENRYQASGSVWREKPLKFLLVTKDLKLSRELTRDLESSHMALSAANYPSFYALERSLPSGTDLIALDEATYADYTRLASKTLLTCIGEAPVVVITNKQGASLTSANVTTVDRGEASQLIGTMLNGIHQNQEAAAAAARQELLN